MENYVLDSCVTEFNFTFLLQMLCEEKGFFLEIVDIIQGFGLTILKGVMEVRKDKIWACFIVEAEVNI